KYFNKDSILGHKYHKSFTYSGYNRTRECGDFIMSNSTSTPNTGLSYKDAGVDIEPGDALVDRIKSVAKRTSRPEVMGRLACFGAPGKITRGYEEPVRVSGTDGVRTKFRLALNLNRQDTSGQDLVAMCVDDLLVCGAEPLFFLDYYATGH